MLWSWLSGRNMRIDSPMRSPLLKGVGYASSEWSIPDVHPQNPSPVLARQGPMWRIAGKITGNKPDLEIRPRPPRDSGWDFQWVASLECEYDREQPPFIERAMLGTFLIGCERRNPSGSCVMTLTQHSESGATRITMLPSRKRGWKLGRDGDTLNSC